MPTFTYEARDTQGKVVSGLIEATEQHGAAAVLREQGLYLTRIEIMGSKPGNARPVAPGAPTDDKPKIDIAPFLSSVPLPDMAMMYRQLATLLDAGVPITQAISTLSAQTRNPRLKHILSECALAVGSGNMLSSVMEKYPSVFTSIQVELIRAGEYGGLMERMCTRLAEYLERELETRRKLKRETLYPKIVLFVAGLVILLLGYLKAGMGQSGLAAVGAKLGFAAIAGGIIFGIWWFSRFANQYPVFAQMGDYVKLLIPAAGNVSRLYATARFARAFGALYAGGVNIIRAMEISARACGNQAIGQRILAQTPALADGEGISGVLARSGLLSPLAVQMARTGEQTGNMDTMMTKVADYLESEADTKSHQLAVGAGVAILVIAGIVVAIIAISFYGGYIGDLVSDRGAGGDGGE